MHKTDPDAIDGSNGTSAADKRTKAANLLAGRASDGAFGASVGGRDVVMVAISIQAGRVLMPLTF